MEENYKELNKKDIAKLLGKSYNTITKWDEEKLQNELLKNCYEILNVEKRGRQIIYTLKYHERDVGEDIVLWLITEYNLKKTDEFKKYLSMRILMSEGGISPMSKREISDNIKVNVNTVSSWDEMLQKIDLLTKDGYFYIKATGFKETYQEEVVTEDEYKAWWKQHSVLDRALRIIEDCKDVPRNEKAYFRENLRMNCNEYYYRIRKCILNAKHPFYNTLKRNLGFED